MPDANGKVTGVTFRRCLHVYDEARRFAPVYDDNDRRPVECDTVLIAAGQSTDLSFLRDGGNDVEEFRPGWPKVDADSLATTAKGVFVAGDLAHGTRLIIDAVAFGKKVARSVYHYVTGHAIRPEAVEAHIPLNRYRREPGYELLRRTDPAVRAPHERFREPGALVEIGYSAAEARREASRCLDCGVTPVFDGVRCVLCGGCVDVCPAACLKIVPLDAIEASGDITAALDRTVGLDADRSRNAAILKDEDRCIRRALCAIRCPVDAISMERVQFTTKWS